MNKKIYIVIIFIIILVISIGYYFYATGFRFSNQPVVDNPVSTTTYSLFNDVHLKATTTSPIVKDNLA